MSDQTGPGQIPYTISNYAVVQPRFVELWREFETEVERDGYFGRRPNLDDVMRRMKVELEYAARIPAGPAREWPQ